MPPKKNAVASRIKRLMQADDDVGKIAQATPVLMAKALDLFLEELMKSTTEIATSHGAKTVSAGHLRASIMGNEKFDFLKEIVEGVPDLPTGQGNKQAVGSLSEGENTRVTQSSLTCGRVGRAIGGPSTTKRERPQKPPATAVEEEDDQPVTKALRSAEREQEQVGSLEEKDSVILGGSIPTGALEPLVGTLTEAPEDDDYDDL